MLPRSVCCVTCRKMLTCPSRGGPGGEGGDEEDDQTSVFRYPCCDKHSCFSCAEEVKVDGKLRCKHCDSDEEVELVVGISEGVRERLSMVEGWRILACTICREQARRAVKLKCCGNLSQACRSCATKRLTTERACWSCHREDLGTDDLYSFKELRHACDFFKDNEGLDDKTFEVLFSLSKKKKSEDIPIIVAKNGEPKSSTTKNMSKLGDDEKVAIKKLLEREEKEREKREKEDTRRRERREKEEKEDRERREKRRKRDRDEREEKDKERKKRRDELEEVFEKQRREAWEKRKKELEEERLVEEERKKERELEEVEEKVEERIEEIITKLVEEQLEMNKKEIENEVLKKIRSARLNMEAEVEVEIHMMKKMRQDEEKRRKEEFDKYMEDAERNLEEEKKKMAEERLHILGELERIDRELRKQKKREEKKFKEEQKKILGKGNARPKLSFSLTKF